MAGLEESGTTLESELTAHLSMKTTRKKDDNEDGVNKSQKRAKRDIARAAKAKMNYTDDEEDPLDYNEMDFDC